MIESRNNIDSISPPPFEDTFLLEELYHDLWNKKNNAAYTGNYKNEYDALKREQLGIDFYNNIYKKWGPLELPAPNLLESIEASK